MLWNYYELINTTFKHDTGRLSWSRFFSNFSDIFRGYAFPPFPKFSIPWCISGVQGQSGINNTVFGWCSYVLSNTRTLNTFFQAFSVSSVSAQYDRRPSQAYVAGTWNDGFEDFRGSWSVPGLLQEAWLPIRDSWVLSTRSNYLYACSVLVGLCTEQHINPITVSPVE